MTKSTAIDIFKYSVYWTRQLVSACFMRNEVRNQWRFWRCFCLFVFVVGGCQSSDKAQKTLMEGSPGEAETVRVATFAGGCFWCTEADFEKVPGVVKVVSGYTGGSKENPSYEEVSSGTTGHVEAVQVYYDPSKVTYEQLLNVFWKHIDPTDPGGQFVDRGAQYRSVIFFHDEEQKGLAETSKQELAGSGRFQKPVVTEIVRLGKFYEAEEYHQDYYKKHALKYKFYRYGSGRDQFLAKVWGERNEQYSFENREQVQ